MLTFDKLKAPSFKKLEIPEKSAYTTTPDGVIWIGKPNEGHIAGFKSPSVALGFLEGQLKGFILKLPGWSLDNGMVALSQGSANGGFFAIAACNSASVSYFIQALMQWGHAAGSWNGASFWGLEPGLVILKGDQAKVPFGLVYWNYAPPTSVFTFKF
jgi:hypothetical protein